MRGLAGGAGVSILAVFAAMVSFGQDGGGAAGSAEVAAPAAAVDEAGADRQLRGPSKGKSTDVPPASPPDACRGGERLLDGYRELYGNHLFRHLIVLTPDPVELGGAEYFDLVLEGVEEAVSEDKGDGEAYVHDHQWIPWTDAAARASRCWERQPGVVVYRPLDGPDRQPPLMVLLVGETPIWGLRATQFDAAMDLIRRHGQLFAGIGSSPYLVLGPTYSGTAASLKAVMRRPSIGEHRFRIVSGTATTVKAQQILAPAPPPRLEHCPGDAKGPGASPLEGTGAVSFESATANDMCLLEKMEEFLLSRGGRCIGDIEGGNIVLFTETSTTFGSVGTESRSASGPAHTTCFRPWKLPPDLASIRKSSEKLEDKKSDGGGVHAEAPLDLPESGEGGGKTLSPTSVAVRALALDSTLDWMSNGKIRFAGIIATDPKDVIFLARRFRQQLPDIRLFTLGASIQYVDERAADAMNGMFVVHSAPGDGNRSMSLRNEFVRKIYYAGRKLLAGERLEPEILVSFIGNGRLWELADFSDHPDGARDGRRRAPTWPIGWQFTLAFFTVLFIAVVVVLALGELKGKRLPRGRFWALVAPCVRVDLRRQDHAISAGLIVVCAGPLLLMLQSMMARRWPELEHWHVCVIVSVLALTLTWLFHFVRLLTETTAATDQRWLAFLPVAASTVVVALSLYACWSIERRSTFHLLSGGSPVLVGLIAMASHALVLWCARTRLRMLDTHRMHAVADKEFVETIPPISQAMGERRGQGSGLADVEHQLLNALCHPWQHASAAPLVVHGLLLLTIAVPIYTKFPHTLEPGWRNVALISLAIVGALATSINLAWFLTSWIRLLRFLRRLAFFPAIAALGRLKDRHARSLEEQLAWSGSEGPQLIQAVDTLGLLAEADETLQPRYKMCRRLLDARLSAEASGEPVGSLLVDLLLETSANLPERTCDEPKDRRARIDDFRASLVDLFIPRYVRHFRLFVAPMVLGCLCSVFLASLYFVQPQRLIASIGLFWVAVTVGTVLVSYVSLYLDPVLSAVAGATGRLTSTSRFALARKIVVWAAVPVAGYLAVEHPEFPLWVSRILDVVGKSLR